MPSKLDTVIGSVVLGLLLLVPVATGVVVCHLLPRHRTESTYWCMWVVAILVLWIYGLIEARSKHGWREALLVLIALPCSYATACIVLVVRTVYEFDHIRWSFPYVFLTWLAAQSLLSAHWYGRRVFTACAMSLVVTACVTAHWYDEHLHWILRRYFMWS
jgi:hypothetical protein